MKTRSQKRAGGQASLKLDGIRQKHTTNKERYEWEHLEIDRMELDELTGNWIVLVKWPNADVSEHDKEEIYEKCPKKMLKFYEKHVQFVDKNETEELD